MMMMMMIQFRSLLIYVQTQQPRGQSQGQHKYKRRATKKEKNRSQDEKKQEEKRKGLTSQAKLNQRKKRAHCKVYDNQFFPYGSTALYVPGPPRFVEASRSHSDTPQSVGLLWTSDQPVAETST